MQLVVNGIDALRGEYLIPPLSKEQVSSMIKGEHPSLDSQAQDPKVLRFLKRVWSKISQPHLGLPLGVVPEDVTKAGWGIVFHSEEADDVKNALEPLVEHRASQIGDDRLIKILEYRDGEDRINWLARHGTASGDVQPTRVPFYLLVVGNPEQIPFQWSQELDVEYAVGRLHFDEAGDYTTYVESLIDYENSDHVPNSKEAVFFAPRHEFDRATQISADRLVNPLVDGWPTEGTLMGWPGCSDRWGFRSNKIWGAEAKKEALLKVLVRQDKPPAYLFTASHGLGWGLPHPDQKKGQGALICQDWPGFGDIRADHCMAGSDIPAEARLHGLVSFHFACYSGGTPAFDRFLYRKGEQPPRIAETPFLAELPKRLLSHPGGTALACIGHVERAWGTSILGFGTSPQIQAFSNALGRTMIGQPLGMALKDFNERLASYSVTLSNLLAEVFSGFEVDDDHLVSAWLARNDAEGYVLIGDPAVRLRVDKLT